MRKNLFLLLTAICCMATLSLQASLPCSWKDGRQKNIDGVNYVSVDCDNSNTKVTDVVIKSGTPSGEVILKDYVALGMDDYWHKVISIKEGALSHITTPFSIVCPSTLTEIEAGAFNYSTGLTGIKINQNVNAIGSQAFRGCTHLASVNIPTPVKVIEPNTFYGCSALPAITLPGVKTIGECAFYGCTSLVSLNGGNVYCPVEVISKAAFSGCTSLRTIHWASGKLKQIWDYAFSECTGLESFVIPSSVTFIGEFAFANSGLKKVRNNSTTPQNIKANVFDGLNLKNCILYVPKGCKAAYKSANVWKEFGNILEPGEQPVVGSNPEQGQTGAIVATGVQKIGNLYYRLHEDLTATLAQDASYKNMSGAITIPTTVSYSGNTYTVTDMQGYVFDGCTHITGVTLPNTITEIPPQAFYGCNRLATISLPSSLTYIGDFAFFNCSMLTSVDLPATLTHLGVGTFKYCTSLASIKIPGDVDTIPFGCFYNCTNLSEVILSNGLKVIGESAFQNTQLSSVTLPASVIQLQAEVFDAASVEAIRCEGKNPATLKDGKLVFNGHEKDIDLYVPVGSKNAYKMADYWKDFKSIKTEGDPEKVLFGDLYYQLDEDFTASVVCEKEGSGNYSYLNGEITVAEKVRHKGAYYTVTAIEANAFKGATGITQVNLPKNIKQILAKAFYGCTGLTSVNIPYSVEQLAIDAFENTPLYTNNTDANGAVYYGGCLLALTQNLPSTYSVKDGTRLIATSVFKNQPIVTLNLPEGLQVLCNSALSDMANLQTVHLPKSLNRIGDSFLHSCIALRDIYNHNPYPCDLTNVYCFGGLNQANCTLRVPAGSKSRYEDAAKWQDFQVTEMAPEYSVRFIDYNDNVLKEETVSEGNDATAPGVSAREGYTFTGWDMAYTNVHADIDVVAQYSRNSYTVRFMENAVSPNPAPGIRKAIKALDSQEVLYGESAVAPEPPVLAGYTFVGWDRDYAIVKADMDIHPIFVEDAKIWTVTYIDNDSYGRTELYRELVKDGEDAQGYPAAHEGVKLWYWLDDDTWEHADLTNVTRNMTVQAYYTEVTFHVTYRVNGDSTYAIDAIYGYNPSYIYYPKGTPTRESTDACDYEFTGWYPEVERLTQDVTLEAQFKEIPHTYTISWNDENGSLIDQTVVEYGETPRHPDGEKAATAAKSYLFTGWTPEIVAATADASYQATFEEVDNCTVYYVDKESSELENELLYLHLPEPPVIAGFTFLKWQTVAGDLTNGITIQAVYKSDQDPTSMPNVVPVPGSAGMKLVRDGIVYILQGDDAYTLTGVKVK